MKSPMCSPCSSGSPQNTGSFALPWTALEIGTDLSDGSSECSGPPRPNAHTPIHSAQ